MATVKQSNMRNVWALIVVGAIFFAVGLSFVMCVFDWLDTFGKVFSCVSMVFGLGLIYLAYFTYQSNKKSYQEFYQLFPELNENMQVALSQASYVSESLGILVYKDYLVNHRRGLFSFVPLKEVNEIGYHWVSKTLRRPAQAFLLIYLKGEKRTKYLEIIPLAGQSRDQSIKAFYAYLNQHFQHIHINQNPTFLD